MTEQLGSRCRKVHYAMRIVVGSEEFAGTSEIGWLFGGKEVPAAAEVMPVVVVVDVVVVEAIVVEDTPAAAAEGRGSESVVAEGAFAVNLVFVRGAECVGAGEVPGRECAWTTSAMKIERQVTDAKVRRTVAVAEGKNVRSCLSSCVGPWDAAPAEGDLGAVHTAGVVGVECASVQEWEWHSTESCGSN